MKKNIIIGVIVYLAFRITQELFFQDFGFILGWIASLTYIVLTDKN